MQNNIPECQISEKSHEQHKKRIFFFLSLTTPDKNDENQTQIHLGIQMICLLSFPLQPRFADVEGGLVGFGRCRQTPGSPCCPRDGVSSSEHPRPGLPPALALSSAQNKATIHTKGFSDRKRCKMSTQPRAINYKILKGHKGRPPGKIFWG